MIACRGDPPSVGSLALEQPWRLRLRILERHGL